MHVFGRLRRLIRQYFAAAPVTGKHPEHALERAVLEIEEHLTEARDDVAACQEHERRLAGLRVEEERLALRMIACAREALQRGQDPLAREALRRHLRARQQAAQYQELWYQLHEGTLRLQALLDALESRRRDLEHRRQLLLARSELTRIRRTLLSSLYGEENRANIEIAEERVLQNELSADAYQALIVDTTAADIDALEHETVQDPVEALLTRLRGELQLPAPEER